MTDKQSLRLLRASEQGLREANADLTREMGEMGEEIMRLLSRIEELEASDLHSAHLCHDHLAEIARLRGALWEVTQLDCSGEKHWRQEAVEIARAALERK